MKIADALMQEYESKEQRNAAVAMAIAPYIKEPFPRLCWLVAEVLADFPVGPTTEQCETWQKKLLAMNPRKNSHFWQIRVSPADDDVVTMAAEDMGISKSELVRRGALEYARKPR